MMLGNLRILFSIIISNVTGKNAIFICIMYLHELNSLLFFATNSIVVLEIGKNQHRNNPNPKHDRMHL